MINEIEMKNVVYFAIGLLVLVAVITNPGEETHKEVVKVKVSEDLVEVMGSASEDRPKMHDIEDLWVGLLQAAGAVFGELLLAGMIEDIVTADNYVLFSTTKITVEGESKVIGVGAFGNVFLSKKFDEKLEEMLDEEFEEEFPTE